MKTLGTFRQLLAVIPLLLVTSMEAQDLDLVGEVSWFRFKKRVEIIAQQVANHSPWASGPIRLQIWATAEPFTGGDLTGYPIATLNLSPLAGRRSYVSIDYLVAFRPPPPGLYYTTMTLEERQSGGYVITDFVTFDGVVNFGTWGVGETTTSPTTDVAMNGVVSWTSANSRVTIRAQEITNSRQKTTGPLRLRLWATEAPYFGGPLTGTPLARRGIGRARSQRTLTNISRRALFRVPEYEGWYYITLALEEYHGRVGWVIVDYVTFPEQSFL